MKALPIQARAKQKRSALIAAATKCFVEHGYDNTTAKTIASAASVATGMPKSGYAANSQAKVCASAVAALLNGKEPGTPAYVNTCYSVIAEDWGISVAAVYRLAEDRSKMNATFTLNDESLKESFDAMWKSAGING